MAYVVVRANFENEVFGAPVEGNAAQQRAVANAYAEGMVAADETQELIVIETDDTSGDVVAVVDFYRKPVERRRAR